MINEVRSKIAKRTLQTVMYLPHFVSWVVVGALFMNILGTTGIVNQVIVALGGETQRFFMDQRVVPVCAAADQRVEGIRLEYDRLSGGDHEHRPRAL